MATLSKGTLFDPTLVTDLVNKVKGKSTLTKLGLQTPVSFNGTKEFTFSMDKDIDIVAENGKKSEGGVTIDPVTIIPIKFEYGARVSDEFMDAEDEEQISILQAFNDGFAAKVARGIDLAALHGVNPRTGTASVVVGNNNFDTAITQTVTYDSADPDTNVEAAVALVEGSDGDVTGIGMSPVFAAALAALKTNGVKQFPELSWGANPSAVNGIPSDKNSTISALSSHDRAIVGDFANMFKWGYAKEIPLEVIPYGDPDNSGNDLKGSNQVYLRAEVYLGWAIMDAASFARIITA
ncbi:phage major capsid protein [Aminicella lysinilytica]|uniref:Capsid family protein n=1 Tax=Aminicella lysinilytica TaxID=433323 RepID=A0A4R6QDA9_9FIRM|nr:phage major capsid protein [Aminicella lysinilytica]TDP59843.1 capsid family protein [Aminicella lysinilytica]